MLRFALSPNGDMHIGNLRVAIFNYIVSKQLNEGLVIRVEDIDKDKNIEGKDKEYLDLLNLFSIDQERVAHQSESLKYHQKMAMSLMSQKKAFVCFCGDEKLTEIKEKAESEGRVPSYDGFCENLSDELILNTNSPFTVRIKKPETNIKFNDALLGDCEYSPDEVDAFNILNHDKTPTYNYACAVDDMLLDVSTVIRDEQFLADSARQIHIRKALGYDKEINYTHIKALSNAEEISVKSLIEEGFLPSAIANYLVLLGNETPKEIFSLEEAIEWFDIKKISTDLLEFDIEKLKEINKKHLETMDEMRLSKILGFADTDIGKLGKLFLDEVSTIKELKEKVQAVFSAKSTCEGFEKEFVELKLCLNGAPYFDTLEELEAFICEKTDLTKENLTKPLACLLTGNSAVDITKVYPLIKNYLGEIVK